MCLSAWLSSPLAVRAARQHVGCRHADTGAVAVPSMTYETVHRCVCLYESYAIMKTLPVSYIGYSSTFLNGAIVRVPHVQGSKPHPSTVFLHNLARGNHFTAGPPGHSGVWARSYWRLGFSSTLLRLTPLPYVPIGTPSGKNLAETQAEMVAKSKT